MPVILLTNSYDAEVRRHVETLVPTGFNFISLSANSKEELLKKAKDADYFIVSGRLPIDREVIKAAKKLKMIQRTGVGIDQIDLEALKESKIPLYINKGVNAQSVAEHALMLILATYRKVTEADGLLKDGIWRKQAFGIQTRSLYDKKVGLIGLGSIGTALVKLLQPFRVKIHYYKRNRLDAETENKYGLIYSSLEYIYANADVICPMCAYTKETHELIDQKAFEQMKPEAIVVNTARGKLINEKALIESLEKKKIAAAGLDVHYNEPINSSSPLTSMKQVVLTAHTAGITRETFTDMYDKAFSNIVCFEHKEFLKIEQNKFINE